jgi:hypothetical protein
MFCAWCGKAAKAQCSSCGRVSALTWLAATAAAMWLLAGTASFLYLWRDLPTSHALLIRFKGEEHLITRLHFIAASGLPGWLVSLGATALCALALRGRSAALSGTAVVTGILIAGQGAA